jgi:hypothetical protein
MSRLTPVWIAIAVLLGSTTPAWSWSYKEHVAITRLAVQRLLADEATPPEMKAWLREVAPDAGDLVDVRAFVVDRHLGPTTQGLRGLSYWAVHPDTDRSTPVPALASTERLMHYVDLEFFHPDPARQRYADDLSGLPEVRDVPRDPADPVFKQAGYLPFRVEQCYDELVTSIREGRLTPDDDREQLDNALAWAGYLAHYLQDNTQPHHGTIDFRSASYFPDAGRQAPNVHGMFEWGFIDDEAMAYPQLRAGYFDGMVDFLQTLDGAREDGASITRIGDPFISTLKVSREMYQYLPTIGRAAQRAVEAGSLDEPDLVTFAEHADERSDGQSVLSIKSAAGALAVARTQDALRQAWLDATRPDAEDAAP